MFNSVQKDMYPSYFRIPSEAVFVVRKMLESDRSESYYDLRAQFMAAIPADKFCFFCVDADTVHAVISAETALRQRSALTVFDPGDDVIAVISKDEILHKEDFADFMKASGLEATEDNFNKVWFRFSPEGSLKESALSAIQTVKEQDLDRSIDDMIRDASTRNNTKSENNPPDREISK